MVLSWTDKLSYSSLFTLSNSLSLLLIPLKSSSVSEVEGSVMYICADLRKMESSMLWKSSPNHLSLKTKRNKLSWTSEISWSSSEIKSTLLNFFTPSKPNSTSSLWCNTMKADSSLIWLSDSGRWTKKQQDFTSLKSYWDWNKSMTIILSTEILSLKISWLILMVMLILLILVSLNLKFQPLMIVHTHSVEALSTCPHKWSWRKDIRFLLIFIV